jgi:hypothetical protein
MTKAKLVSLVAIIVTITLSTIIIAMSFAMVIGLFNEKVSNEEIFKILAPTFSTVVGGFIGLLSGIKIGQGTND